MLILNTYITDNSGPARIFTIQKSQPVNNFDIWGFVLWLRPPPIQPITEPGAFLHPGCQLSMGRSYERVGSQMSDVIKPERPRYGSQQRQDKDGNKTRTFLGDAFKRWRPLKAEKNLKTDTEVANFTWTGNIHLGFAH